MGFFFLLLKQCPELFLHDETEMKVRNKCNVSTCPGQKKDVMFIPLNCSPTDTLKHVEYGRVKQANKQASFLFKKKKVVWK